MSPENWSYSCLIFYDMYSRHIYFKVVQKHSFGHWVTLYFICFVHRGSVPSCVVSPIKVHCVCFGDFAKRIHRDNNNNNNNNNNSSRKKERNICLNKQLNAREPNCISLHITYHKYTAWILISTFFQFSYSPNTIVLTCMS